MSPVPATIACDYNALDSLRKVVPKEQRSALQRSSCRLLRRAPSSNADQENAHEASAAKDHARAVTYSELTDEEVVDNEVWKMRFLNDEVFGRNYALKEWEKKEMKLIIEFLDLKNPADHADCLYFNNRRGQKTTCNAVRSIFFPNPQENQSVLLKRGLVMVGGEERELMLFTGGFTISRIELGSLLNLLIDARSGRVGNAGFLQNRFNIVDEDGNGSLDHRELSEFFRFMGITLSDVALGRIMKRLDSDSDGMVCFDEFKSMMEKLHQEKDFMGKLCGKSSRKLDFAFRMADIDDVQNMGVCQIRATKKLVSSQLAPITLAVFIKNIRTPFLVTCSKPGHVEAWEEAFRVSRLARNSSQLAKNVSPHNNEGKVESLQQALAEDSCAKNRFRMYIRRLKNDTMDESSDEPSPGNENTGANCFELTDQEQYDNKLWQMRFQCNEVYAKSYVPAWWEKKELDSIVEFLALKNPMDHPDFLSKPEQQMTNQAVRSIFFPKENEQQPVLLKRGPVVLTGEERELMLFTNGFVASCVDPNTLVNLLLTSSSGKFEQLNCEKLFEHFSRIDFDGNGSLDNDEVRSFFYGVGMRLSETVVNEVVNRFDSDSDGMLSFDEFKAMVNELRSPPEEKRKKPVRRGLGELTKSLTETLSMSMWDGVENTTKEKRSATCGEQMGGNLTKAHTGKLDVAFKISDIETIENMGACRNTELKKIVGKKFAPRTLIIYLKDVDVPLVVMCAKPGSVKAWENAFIKCMSRQTDEDTRADAPIKTSSEEPNSSCIDWG